MKRLKVLFPVHVFFPDHFYGTETYTLELAKCIQAMGHDVAVMTSVPFGEKGTGKLHSTYTYDGLDVHCIDLNLKPHSRFKETYYRPELYPILRDVVCRVDPDIVHITHLINHSATLLEVLRDLRLPTIATLTDFFGLCFNNRLEFFDSTLCQGPNRNSTNCLYCYVNTVKLFSKSPALQPFLRNDPGLKIISQLCYYATKLPIIKKTSLAGHVFDVTKRLDTLKYLYSTYRYMIAPTEFLYEAYTANNFYPDRLRKINFGINLGATKGYQNIRNATTGNVRFGYIGQLAPHKGVDLLVQAFFRIREDNKSLVIYGPLDQDTSYVEQLKQDAANGNNITFQGTFPSDELPQRLSEIDVLVIPSRWYENSPLVLLYALATKTPVIVTDVKGMNEFVKDGYNGFTFPMNSLDQLTAAMQRLIDRPETIEKLSQNACYAKDVSNHAEETNSLYELTLREMQPNHDR